MEGKNSQLLTIIFVAFIAIVVLWLLLSLDKNDVCYGAVPDPVGNVLAENVGPGEVKISWDPTPNATKYRVYLNTCPEEVTASRKKCTAGNRSVHVDKVAALILHALRACLKATTRSSSKPMLLLLSLKLANRACATSSSRIIIADRLVSVKKYVPLTLNVWWTTFKLGLFKTTAWVPTFNG